MALWSVPLPVDLAFESVSLGFDIGQGAGLAGATGVRPFLPPILTGALARGDIGVDFDGTTLRLGRVARVPAGGARASPSPSTSTSGGPPKPEPGERSQVQAILALIAMVLGAVLFGASLAEGGETEWPGVIAGMACAFLGFAAVALLFARARARLEGGAAALLNVYADVTALVIAGLTILFPPLGYVVLVAFVVLLLRAQRGGERKYEGLRILSVKKLVLAVIDALKPEMLERAVEQGRAPALEQIMKRGTYVPECVSTFPSVTPVAAAAIATGTGPADHHIPSMNWFHRGEQRYVEYGSSFEASRQFGLLRSLQDTVYNMNLAHLSRDVKTVFEHLQDAGRRTVGTTYLMFRGRTRHEASDEGMYPQARALRQLPPRGLGPGRAVLRGRVRVAEDGLPRARSACRASATSTRPASAPTAWRTTCSTSCCSRCPTTTRTRTSAGRTRR